MLKSEFRSYKNAQQWSPLFLVSVKSRLERTAMDRWRNKIAVVTGASAGIGAAIVADLVKSGLIAVGLARRDHKVKEIQKNLPKELQSRLHPFKCDVSNEDDVKKAFSWIDKELGGPHILVNNAGIVRDTELIRPDNTKDIKDVVDTNIMGVMYCTREAFNSMKARKVDGHIVTLNSVVGHKIPFFRNDLPSANIYPATKFAITAMVESYRQEFRRAGTNVKITSVSPGLVLTEILAKGRHESMKDWPALQPEDVSNAVMYAIGTPPHVQIHELTIKPMGELF